MTVNERRRGKVASSQEMGGPGQADRASIAVDELKGGVVVAEREEKGEVEEGLRKGALESVLCER